MTREADILHENAGFYVHRDTRARALMVYRPSASGTHAYIDSAYPDTIDGLSCAKARCDYLARRAA